jgi:glycosyltransferase involved in cell wall biosynthesis
LYVGKPLRPPFRDGSTVLVAGLATGLEERFDLAYAGDPERPLRPDDTVIPMPPMGYQPTLTDKLRVLGMILSPRHAHRGLHFFFTPNPTTSRVLAGVRRLQPRRPMVQSVMSAHDVERFAPLLRSLDAVVVLSERTRQRLVVAGLDPDRVIRIYPAVAIPEPAPAPTSGPPVVLYAGDLDPAAGRRLERLARALPENATLVVACRPKAREDARVRQRLRSELGTLLEAGQVELHAEVPDMDALLGSVTLQVFVADHVRNKVDLPLVLLEGLARGVPLVALEGTAVGEIFERAEELDLSPGVAVAEEGLTGCVTDVLTREQTLLEWRRDARSLAEQTFSLPRMIREHEALYDRLRP